jgi:structural maintenance of chromosome 2
MQDLIYMNGQSGVKEAAVTLSFDNTDKSQSPSAYRDVDTINVTRKIIVRIKF